MQGILTMEQRQVLSEKQVQSLEVLSFTNQELQEFLTREYLENPLLEISSIHTEETDGAVDIEQTYESNISYKEHYLEWKEEDSARTGEIAAEQIDELEEILLGQLESRAYSSEQWKLMKLLIHCLDEDGFFRYTPEEIGKVFQIPAAQVEDCLEVLKELEPPGIFSGDLSECLLKQLEQMDIQDNKVSQIVQTHLWDIINGHIAAVAKELSLTTDEIKGYIQIIRKLNPRPLMNVSQSRVDYIIPDILVTRVHNHWDVTINDQWIGVYQYNDYYMKMMRETKDPECISYFQNKMERAKFIFNCIEQRRKTITQIVKVILDMQEDYFLRSGELAVMSLGDVAQVTGVHSSTVSRAIKGKYLQYRQVVLIKDLFASSILVTGDEGAVRAENVKEMIRMMIENENVEHPLSDAQIVLELGRQGVKISRRTAAKYRLELGIVDSRQRRYY